MKNKGPDMTLARLLTRRLCKHHMCVCACVCVDVCVCTCVWPLYLILLPGAMTRQKRGSGRDLQLRK